MSNTAILLNLLDMFKRMPLPSGGAVSDQDQVTADPSPGEGKEEGSIDQNDAVEIVPNSAPAIVEIKGEFSEGNIIWSVIVLDDEPKEELHFFWEFDESHLYQDQFSNPAIMEGCVFETGGVVSITVTDQFGYGESTTAYYVIQTGYFPGCQVKEMEEVLEEEGEEGEQQSEKNVDDSENEVDEEDDKDEIDNKKEEKKDKKERKDKKEKEPRKRADDSKIKDGKKKR